MRSGMDPSNCQTTVFKATSTQRLHLPRVRYHRRIGITSFIIKESIWILRDLRILVLASNEMSDNVYRELCGFQKPNIIDHSDQYRSSLTSVLILILTLTITMKLTSEIQMTCYQHVQSGESNSTTHFVQIKREPNICVKSSNHITCSETEVHWIIIQ